MVISKKFIRRLAVQPAVFKIIIVYIPLSEFTLQAADTFEMMLLVKLFFVLSVAALYGPILGRLTRVNEIMDDALVGAEPIERVDGFYSHVAPLVGAKIVIGEDRTVIGFHRVYAPGK